jgi:hypothetical protein
MCNSFKTSPSHSYMNRRTEMKDSSVSQSFSSKVLDIIVKSNGVSVDQLFLLRYDQLMNLKGGGGDRERRECVSVKRKGGTVGGRWQRYNCESGHEKGTCTNNSSAN